MTAVEQYFHYLRQRSRLGLWYRRYWLYPHLSKFLQGLDAQLMTQDVIPFSDGSFEGAVMDNVLEHLNVPHPLLCEICRVMQPGGTLVVGVPGTRGYDTDPDHKVHYEEATLVSTMATLGFCLRQVFHAPMRSDWMNKRMREYCLYGVLGND